MKKWSKGDLAKSAAKVFFTVGPAAAVASWAHALAPDNVLGAFVMGGVTFAETLYVANSKAHKKVPMSETAKEILADEEKSELLGNFLGSRTGPEFIDIPHKDDTVRISRINSVTVHGSAAGHNIK
jgi:hypothetical protein